MPPSETTTDRHRRRIHTVLIADDDEQIRALVWEILASEGFRVMPARNGHEAVEILHQHSQGIDVLIADVVMPRVGGRELAIECARIAPHVRVLFASGYGGNDDFRAEFPDAEVLEKPFRPAQLIEQVRAALRRR